MWENFGVGNFWQINGSKVFGEEKFAKSVGSILKILAFIKRIANRSPNSPKFSPSKIFPCTVCENICLQHKTPSTIHSKIKSAIEANLNLR